MPSLEKRQDAILPDLIEQGLVTAEQVERAKSLAAAGSGKYSAIYHLIRQGVLKAKDAQRALEKRFRVETIDLAAQPLDDATLALLNKDIILEHRVLPVEQRGRKVIVAMSDHLDFGVLDRLKFACNLSIQPALADEHSIEEIISTRFENHVSQVEEMLKKIRDGEASNVVEMSTQSVEDEAIEAAVNSAPIVQLVAELLSNAVRRKVSDIHFEFFEHSGRVRYRIDSALVTETEVDPKWAPAIMTRLKILAKKDTTERRLPQDGRISYEVDGRTIDFRFASVPTTHGEKAVLRVLDKGAVALKLDNLGVPERDKATIRATIESPNGIVLVTGPTGSGKTTTLYTLLSMLSKPDVNIMTAEDPVEYDLEGINQVQVNAEIGMSFLAALRSFLRQDPDVIMVGEMRDTDTAKTGYQAAMTGHLVLSTLHTNSSAEAAIRLLEMGVERVNVATVTSLIIAQRLARRVCANCAEVVRYPMERLELAGLSAEEIAQGTFRAGRGCAACDGTGYKGRIGIYEVMKISEAIENLILKGATAREIQTRAVAEGMVTLRRGALNLLCSGVTTLDEVFHHTKA